MDTLRRIAAETAAERQLKQEKVGGLVTGPGKDQQPH